MADGLERAGIELVAAGATAFTNSITKAVKGLDLLGGASKLAAVGLNALNQVGVGALRRIGELAVDSFLRAGRAALRWSDDLLQAAARGTDFGRTMERVYPSLVETTRVSFGPLFAQLDQLVQRAAPAFLGVVQAAETYLGGLAQNALTWGENITASLASGIWAGVGYVIDALSAIAQSVAFWLAPGSPPRLLPDLDAWGTEAAQVYLDAWQRADFDVFQSLAGPIEQLLRSAAPRGDTALIPTILGTREAIAQAVEQARQLGTVTEDSLSRIYAAAGAATPAMRDFLRATFDAELTSGALADAQRELASAAAAYEALLRPIDDRLAAISEEQMQLTEEGRKSQLALLAADPNATASERRQAALEIERIDAERARRAALAEGQAAVDTAQAKVDAAQAAHDAALDELAAKREAIGLQTEQNRLIQEQLALMERLAELATGAAPGAPKPPGGAGGGGKPPGPTPFPALDISQFIPDSIFEKIEALKTAFETAWERIKAVFQPAVDVWNTQVVPAWNNLVDTVRESLPDMEEEIGRFVAFVVRLLGNQVPVVLANLATSLNTLARIWEAHGAAIMSVVRVAFQVIAAIVIGTMTVISAVITATLLIIEGVFNTVSAAIEGKWKTAWESITTALRTAEFIINYAIGVVIAGILDAFGLKVETIAAGVVTALGPVETTVNTIKDAFYNLWLWLNTHIFDFKINLPSLPDWAIPGSPTPFELGLRGIDKALRELNAVRAPAGSWGGLVAPPMSAAQVATSYAYSYTNAPVLNWSPVYNVAHAPSEALSYETVRAMWGR